MLICSDLENYYSYVLYKGQSLLALLNLWTDKNWIFLTRLYREQVGVTDRVLKCQYTGRLYDVGLSTVVTFYKWWIFWFCCRYDSSAKQTAEAEACIRWWCGCQCIGWISGGRQAETVTWPSEFPTYPRRMFCFHLIGVLTMIGQQFCI